jgi:hypothetical protein
MFHCGTLKLSHASLFHVFGWEETLEFFQTTCPLCKGQKYEIHALMLSSLTS